MRRSVKRLARIVFTNNRTQAYEYATKKDDHPNSRHFGVDAFGNAWFLCTAYEKGVLHGWALENTLVDILF